MLFRYNTDKLNPFYGVDPDDSAELFTELPNGNMELLPHSSGGLPNITDAVFSVIVVFYVRDHPHMTSAICLDIWTPPLSHTYRVTHQVEANLPLTSKQQFHFGLA